MAVATASSATVANPYDEMVVPALRKRLEAESRVLSSRMSGNFDALSIPDIPSHSVTSHSHSASSSHAIPITTGPTSATAAMNIPSSKSQSRRVASPELYTKPSSIPRPSLQMSAQGAQSTRDLLAGVAQAGKAERERNGERERDRVERERAVKSERIAQVAVMHSERERERDRNRERERERERVREREREDDKDAQQERAPRARSRTQSTPFAYNELVATSAAAQPDLPVPSVLPTPASSRANSPQAVTPLLGTNPAYNLSPGGTGMSSRPSGIPVPRSGSAARPTAKTPRSRSRNATSPIAFPASSAADDGPGSDDAHTNHQPNNNNQQQQQQHLRAGAGAAQGPGRMRYPPSPEPSPELSYIRNVQAPFPLSGSVMAGGASDSDAGRSSFERDMRASRAARRRGGREGRDGREREQALGGEGPGELELNYRGDTTRNGGRGEVYKEHTEEQLEIATFGHDLSAERKALNGTPTARRRGELDHLGVLDGGRTPRGKGSAPSPSVKQQAAWGELAHAAGVEYGYGEGEGYESGEYELHEESVIRERPLTWMVEGEASVTDLVLESLRNEGGRQSFAFLGQPAQDEAERASHSEQEEWELAYEEPPEERVELAYEREEPPEETALRNGAGTMSKVEPMQSGARGQPQNVLSKSAPVAQRPVEAPPTLPAGKALSKTNGNSAPAGPSSGPPRQPTTGPKPSATPATPRQRVASKPSKVSGPSASGKSNTQPRSKSHPVNLHKHQYQDSNASMSLVDAIPDVPKRGNERGKNWDEVVLPTVARQLGLDRQENGPPEPPETREEMVPPAPGTFGYDHSKYRAPSTDLSAPLTPRPQSPQSADGHLAPPERPSRRPSQEIVAPKPPVQPPIQIPPRQPSPAPFSSYSPLSADGPPVQPAAHPTPILQKSSTALERGKDPRNSKPPKIKISPPDGFAMDIEQDEDKVSGGCKCCVVM
ncbi:hypothetical protein CALCODRAFT_515283 [Calocera cornea HHB12733]|uniref:Uncharacterized protein n=1 Tax=Calocera cornea HHB12733 TaxID=1353952 RepID=A0A165IKN1_9BASI|nr:hypothetical protein CALCODRAFT_515283 [Calocera cornea HHB12733]